MQTLLFFVHANLVAGTLATFVVWSLVRSRSWRQARPLVVVALTATLYSLVTWFQLHTRGPLAPSYAFATLFGALHSSAWLFASAQHLGRTATRFDRAASAVACGVGLLSFVPGALFQEEVALLSIPWAGDPIRVATTTELGSALLPLCIAPMPIAAVRLWRGGRGVPGARRFATALAVYLLAAANEVFVGMGLYRNIFLADVGFLVVVLVILYEMAVSVTASAERLRGMSEELGRLAEERAHQVERLQDALVRTERLASVGQLAASVGHELNNSLSYVTANVEYLSSAMKDAAREHKDALADTLVGARQIGRIVQDLRAFTQQRPGEGTCDPARVAEEAVRFTHGAVKRHAVVAIDAVPTPAVALDPQRLGQVLINLLINAAQAMPPERSRAGEGRITVRVRSGERVEIDVEDNGCGMSEETRAHLCEPFFTTKPVGVGTGLGLFVTLGIIRACGGSIEIDSAVGGGTTVRLRLPIATERRKTTKPPARGPSGEPSVLVVDDDEPIGRSITRQLSDCRVTTVHRATAALDALEQGDRYDVVICDLAMPDRNGDELYEEVRRRWPAIADRFLFITAGATTPELADFAEAFGSRTLAKPLDTGALRVRVQEIAARARVQA